VSDKKSAPRPIGLEKSQDEIDQKSIEAADSPEDERFVEIAERVKSYLEEEGIEILFTIKNHQLKFSLGVDYEVVPRPWVAEMLVIAWHQYEKKHVKRPIPTTLPNTLGEMVSYDEIIRIDLGAEPTIEHSVKDLDVVMRVLAGVRDSLLAEQEELRPKKKKSKKTN